MCVVYDGAGEKIVFKKLIPLSHCFIVLSMMQEYKKTVFKKLILLKHYFLCVVYDGAIKKAIFNELRSL